MSKKNHLIHPIAREHFGINIAIYVNIAVSKQCFIRLLGVNVTRNIFSLYLLFIIGLCINHLLNERFYFFHMLFVNVDVIYLIGANVMH